MDLVVHGEGTLVLMFENEIDGQVREVTSPPVTLREHATGEDVKWWGEGTPLRPGSYDVLVSVEGEDGVLKRHNVYEARIQDGETTGPIRVQIHRIHEEGYGAEKVPDTRRRAYKK